MHSCRVDIGLYGLSVVKKSIVRRSFNLMLNFLQFRRKRKTSNKLSYIVSKHFLSFAPPLSIRKKKRFCTFWRNSKGYPDLHVLQKSWPGIINFIDYSHLPTFFGKNAKFDVIKLIRFNLRQRNFKDIPGHFDSMIKFTNVYSRFKVEPSRDSSGFEIFCSLVFSNAWMRGTAWFFSTETASERKK